MTEPVVTTMGDPSGARDVLRAAAMRSATARDADTGMVWVLSYDEVSRVAHDPRTVGVGLGFFDLMGIDDGALRRWYSSLMFTNEGDTHGRLRRLVSRAFTPRSTERLRSAASEMVGDAFRRVQVDGGGDLIDAFGRVPMRVMCRLLGVPDADVAVFGDWADQLSPTFGFMDAEQIDVASGAIEQLLGYVGALVGARREDPADDLITALLAAEDEGDRLTHAELVAMVANLLVGGHDTTASQIACSFLTLLRHPDSLDEIRRRPAITSVAVMETMRYEPSIGAIPRTVAEPFPVGAEERPVGTAMLLSVMTANRDPAVWDEPDSFVVDRFASPTAPKLLSFGTGPHYCLGANLARMTLEETVLGLAAQHLTPARDLDEVEWRTVLGRSPVSLAVVS